MVFSQMHSYNDWSNASCQNDMHNNKIGNKLPKDLQGVDISDKETWSVVEYNQSNSYLWLRIWSSQVDKGWPQCDKET